jgi:hypothetical protein
MTERLKQAAEKAAAVRLVEGQDPLPDALSVLTDEERALDIFLGALNELNWEISLANSQDKLARMAQRAREAYEAGETEILNLNKL